MSMNMYMMNLLNGVEALTEDLNTVEKEVHDNDAELLSIDANLSQLKTRIDDTESNISLIETNKQDKLGVLSVISLNKLSCNQVLIGSSNVISEISTIKSSIAYTNLNKQDVLGESSVISLGELSCNKVIIGSSDVGDEISTIKSSIAKVSSNLTSKQDKLLTTSNLTINSMSCSQLLVGDSNIITEIDAIKNSSIDTDYIDKSISDIKTEINESTDTKLATNTTASTSYANYISSMHKSQSNDYIDTKLITNKTESDAYTDSKVAGLDSIINNCIVSPSIDLANKVLTEVSIVNKLYIDQKAQQLWDALNSYHTITDFSLKGIHTIDFSSFDAFTITIGAYSTVKIASLRYSPRNSNSRHNCFFNTPYRFPSGLANGSDAARSYAKIYQEGVLKYQSFQSIQYWVGHPGGGSRSGVIFPLQFSVKPRLLNSKEITIEIWIRNDCDDPIQVESTEGTWFTCNEIKGA